MSDAHCQITKCIVISKKEKVIYICWSQNFSLSINILRLHRYLHSKEEKKENDEKRPQS